VMAKEASQTGFTPGYQAAAVPGRNPLESGVVVAVASADAQSCAEAHTVHARYAKRGDVGDYGTGAEQRIPRNPHRYVFLNPPLLETATCSGFVSFQLPPRPTRNEPIESLVVVVHW